MRTGRQWPGGSPSSRCWSSNTAHVVRFILSLHRFGIRAAGCVDDLRRCGSREIATTEGRPYRDFPVEYPPVPLVATERRRTEWQPDRRQPGLVHPPVRPRHHRRARVRLGPEDRGPLPVPHRAAARLPVYDHRPHRRGAGVECGRARGPGARAAGRRGVCRRHPGQGVAARPSCRCCSWSGSGERSPGRARRSRSARSCGCGGRGVGPGAGGHPAPDSGMGVRERHGLGPVGPRTQLRRHQ